MAERVATDPDPARDLLLAATGEDLGPFTLLLGSEKPGGSGVVGGFEEGQPIMKKNRKKADTYRFNGHACFHADSIHSVQMSALESRIKEFEAKLADADDPDDKKWTARWLNRFRKELDKKRQGRTVKQKEKQRRRRTKGST